MKRIFNSKMLTVSAVALFGAAQLCAMNGSMRAPLLDEKTRKFTSLHDSPPEKGKPDHVAIPMEPIMGALAADPSSGTGLLPVTQPDRVIDPAQAVKIVEQINAAAGAPVAEYDPEDQTVVVEVSHGCCAHMRDTIQQWLAGVRPGVKDGALVFISWLGAIVTALITGETHTAMGLPSTWALVGGGHSAEVLMPYPKKIKIPLLVLAGLAHGAICYFAGADVLLGAMWYIAALGWTLVDEIRDPDGLDARSIQVFNNLPAPVRAEVAPEFAVVAKRACDNFKRAHGVGH